MAELRDILDGVGRRESARDALGYPDWLLRLVDGGRGIPEIGGRKPSIGPVDPNLVEADPEIDPDRLVADIAFGKGTGSLPKDLLLGLTGGLAGPATEALGGQSGVLDWIPGGGILKGGVLAAPKAIRALAKAGVTTAQDVGAEAVRVVAQGALDRLARLGRAVTDDDIAKAVEGEMGVFTSARDASSIRGYAKEAVQRSIADNMDDIAAGKPVNLTPEIRKEMDLGRKGMDDEAGNIANRNEYLRKFRQASRDMYYNLGEEDRRALDEYARRLMEEKYKKLIDDGVPHAIAYDRASSYAREAKFLAARRLTQPRQTVTERFYEAGSGVGGDDAARARISEAAREAYRAAMDEALAQGMSRDEAKHVANIAYDRAKRSMMHDIGGDALKARLDYKKMTSRNIAAATNRLAPEVKMAFEREADAVREEARKRALENGATPTIAARKSSDAYKTFMRKKTVEYVKSLGFKNANDPRLTNLSEIGPNTAANVIPMPEIAVPEPEVFIRAASPANSDDILSTVTLGRPGRPELEVPPKPKEDTTPVTDEQLFLDFLDMF